MMSTTLRNNERSWAIEIISKIDRIASQNGYIIKKAGGEKTISTQYNRMFPDLLLYSDKEQTQILQGWELKMPDIPIEDETFIKDAQRKAEALNINSCMIWNFSYAVLYVKGDDGVFTIAKQWNDTSFIRTREDVTTHRAAWEKLIETIIFELNEFFITGVLKGTSLGDIISTTVITNIINRNKKLVSEYLYDRSKTDAVMDAYLSSWWSEIKTEYENDEDNAYNAYSKSVIINWVNRIIFAHLIKHTQNAARRIDELCLESTPSQANDIFIDITEKADFFNVFTALKYNELLPNSTWNDLIELSLFLKNNGVDHLEHESLQNVLEGSININKRLINGQYTTPNQLSKMLVRLSVRNWNDDFIDCCCGTGTIAKNALLLKADKIGVSKAMESVWASDKYSLPLQVANISMTLPSAINQASRIFQHNALNLTPGEEIEITDPESGKKLKLTLPVFGTIATNLPFVEFERIPSDDIELISSNFDSIDARSDLYCYITLHLSNLIKPDGILGIITSNSWLGTISGEKFIAALKEHFFIRQVHISGKSRWFKNADIVTTIMILQKKGELKFNKTYFFIWKKSLAEFEANEEYENALINSALLEKENQEVVDIASYTSEEIHKLLKYNISYNALFHKVDWLTAIDHATADIGKIFTVIRGSRRGWDSLFYPQKGSHHIEPVYIEKVLLNARKVTKLVTKADDDVFCCGKDISELQASGHTGAIEWIDKFKRQTNKVGKPLPDVLKKEGMHWYEIKRNEMADFFTMMNPDKRLFFGTFEKTPAFINQRLIGLKIKKEYPDKELNHALLNSVFTMFCIEASGFGRGLGVLDINKNSIKNCLMFDPSKVNLEQRKEILEKFAVIKSREIKNINDELMMRDRLDFEQAVFSTYGVQDILPSVINSLLSLQKTRSTVNER